MKLLIFGASGSGTTTLGQTLGKQLGWKHLDADDYYWVKTDPPFQTKLAHSERNNRLWKDYSEHDELIISGSLVTWHKAWEKAFDLAVFLWIPPKTRIKRLKAREIERYGDTLLSDPKTRSDSTAFIEWAKKYDDPAFTGRSITQHQDWIKLLTCPVLQLKKNYTNLDRLTLIENKLEELKFSKNL